MAFVSGEILLTCKRVRPANGGSMVLFRALWASAVVYAGLVILVQVLDPSSTFSFSWPVLHRALFNSRRLYGAVFAAVYLGLYTRFSQQWQYLANLYNQIMAVELGTLASAGPRRNDLLAIWKAAFIQDAYTVHLLAKPQFKGIALTWLRCGCVRDQLLKYSGGKAACTRILETVGLENNGAERTSPYAGVGHLQEHAVHIGHGRAAVVWLRLISSFAWLDSAFVGKDAKISAAFLSGEGLAKTITTKFIHTAVTPSVEHLLQNVVLPHAQIFAIVVGLGHLAVGLSLLLGLFTRVGGVLCILLAATNIVVAGGAGPDTIGFNSMLITAGAIFIATRAGRRFGIDGLLLARWPSARFLGVVA